MPRAYRSWKVVVTIAAAFVISASAESGTTETVFARQATPDLASATSINWWPYPAYSSWGAITATTGTDPSTFTPVSSFMAAVSPTTNDAATDSSTVSQSTSPSPTSSSPTSTGSMIYITALPPARTPRRSFSRSSKSSFNIASLAPLFAVIGVAVGITLTWLFFCLSRGRLCCRRSRRTQLRAGPKYEAAPTACANANNEGDVERISGSRFLGLMKQGQKSLRESVLSRGNSTKPSWLQRGASSHEREAAALTPGRTVSHGAAERGDASMYSTEDDPFLPLPTTVAGPSSTPGNAAQAARSRSVLSRSPYGTDILSDNDDDDAPYDTLRHKSIRRGILERLKHGSRYRGGHKRVDSDVRVDDPGAAGAAYTPVSLVSDRTPSQASCINGHEAHPAPLIDSGASGPGFRIVQEDPEPNPMQSGGLLGLNWTLPWIASPDKLNTEDKFTAIPSRRSLAERRNSPTPGHSRTTSSTSVKDSLTEDPVKPSFPRVDSSVLPTSPPRVTSPPLDAQLFFGTIPQKFGVTPQLEFEFPGPTRNPMNNPSAAGSPCSKSKKLHTRRSPPLLPYPSSGKFSPFTNRLTKSNTHASATPEHVPTLSPTSTRSHAERSTPRHGPHNKVDEILAKSWSTRKLNGEERVGSPTMFGAIAESDGTPKGGIEQRLLG